MKKTIVDQFSRYPRVNLRRMKNIEDFLRSSKVANDTDQPSGSKRRENNVECISSETDSERMPLRSSNAAKVNGRNYSKQVAVSKKKVECFKI